MPDERIGNVITGFLCIAYDDLSAAKLLASAGNRNATYQCEQAAEKIILAILTSEGIHGGIKHDLDQMVAKVPDANPLKVRLQELTHLARYATTYRYPTPRGRILEPLDPTSLADAIHKVDHLLAELVRRFGVELGKPEHPAKTPGPIR